jgi:hypothetical protein
MAAERKAPTCRSCGKSLRKRTYHAEVPAGGAPPTEIYGEKVVAVMRRRLLTYRPGPPTEELSLWAGEWGNYGDSFFCGLRCGYRYAVRSLRGAR